MRPTLLFTGSRVQRVAREIERKFVLNERPDGLEEHEGEAIKQGYLAIVEDVREVRLRRRGEDRLLTVKLGSGEERAEVEVELNAQQFDELWPLTEGLRLEKTRYKIPHDGLTIEVDVYGKAFDGMVVAEIEFESHEASQAFDAPSWLGREVTGDTGYANESLALHGAPSR
jgi:adenylate cyclase